MQSSIEEIVKNSLSLDEVKLQKPKESSFGNYATPIAFSLAKELRKNPKTIASELCQKLKVLECFESVEPLGGYINMRLSQEYLDKVATIFLEDPKRLLSIKSEKVLLEFVSANPTGPLHIGHARGAVFGDTLLKVGRYLGYKIDSEYYVNDAGNQINLLGLSIYLSIHEKILKNSVEYPESYYRGEYIDDLASYIYSKHKDDLELEKEECIPKLSEIGKNLMLKEIEKNLKSAGIVFDKYISESEIFKKWDETRDELILKNALYEDEKKLYLKSQMFGDEKDRVVVRDSGEPTYLAGDIVYHRDKFQREYDRYINIWGADHHGYISRVKASIKHLGFDESRLEIILSQMVSLLKNGEPYKMSKRAGNFILMRDIIDEIGQDALRYIFLSKKSDTHLEFDIENLKKDDNSNPLFYINYAHARVYSLIEKSSFGLDEIVSYKIEGAISEELKDLLFLALSSLDALEDAYSSRSPNKLCDYLTLLASSFHRFYNSTKVLGEKDELSYLKIALIVAKSIKLVLSLMGVEAKNRM